jgi:hypothetical protein
MTELVDAAKAKARNRIVYRRPFPDEECAARDAINLMYASDPPILGNGAGRPPSTTVVACAIALYDSRSSFRNETDAKEHYGVARGTEVSAKWQPLLAALERCAPDAFATLLRRARDAKPRKGPSEQELAALRRQRDKQSLAKQRARTLRMSWDEAMQEGVEKAQRLVEVETVEERRRAEEARRKRLRVM